MAGAWSETDFSPWTAELERLGVPRKHADAALASIADILAEDIKARAPKASGELAASIEGVVEGDTVRVGSPLPYASLRLDLTPGREAAGEVKAVLGGVLEGVTGGGAAR